MNQREAVKKMYEDAVRDLKVAETERKYLIERTVKKARKQLRSCERSDTIVEQLLRDLLPLLPAESQAPLVGELFALAENPHRLFDLPRPSEVTPAA